MHLATKERMGYEKLPNVNEMTIVVGSLWWNFVLHDQQLRNSTYTLCLVMHPCVCTCVLAVLYTQPHKIGDLWSIHEYDSTISNYS